MHSPQRGKVKQRGIQPTQPIGLGGGPGDVIYSILSHRFIFNKLSIRPVLFFLKIGHNLGFHLTPLRTRLVRGKFEKKWAFLAKTVKTTTLSKRLDERGSKSDEEKERRRR